MTVLFQRQKQLVRLVEGMFQQWKQAVRVQLPFCRFGNTIHCFGCQVQASLGKEEAAAEEGDKGKEKDQRGRVKTMHKWRKNSLKLCARLGRGLLSPTVTYRASTRSSVSASSRLQRSKEQHRGFSPPAVGGRGPWDLHVSTTDRLFCSDQHWRVRPEAGAIARSCTQQTRSLGPPMQAGSFACELFW